MQPLPSRFNNFFDSPPILKLSEMSLFPCVQDLLPRNPLLLYTPQGLADQGIDLEYNLLWYYNPSVGSVVFYTWQQLEGVDASHQPKVPSPSIKSSKPSGNVSNSSLSKDYDKDELFVMVPCTYRTSKTFYDQLITEEGRKLAQDKFMSFLDVLTDEQVLTQVVTATKNDTSQPSNEMKKDKGHSRHSSSSSSIFQDHNLVAPSHEGRSFFSDTSSSEGEPDEIPNFPLPPLLMRYANTMHVPCTPPKKPQSLLSIDDPDYEDNELTPKCFRSELRTSLDSNRSSVSSVEDILWVRPRKSRLRLKSKEGSDRTRTNSLVIAVEAVTPTPNKVRFESAPEGDKE
ncbi:hypothetical protein FS842_001579 [Serendipita sp. 407]|nr:hypothetical protein FS842_001579 [Serendipita sp. 407]